MDQKFTINDRSPRKEGESRIYNLIILDESGSMQSIYDQALTGVNETIETIRNGQQDNPNITQMISFVTFDSGNRSQQHRAAERWPHRQDQCRDRRFRLSGADPRRDG